MDEFVVILGVAFIAIFGIIWVIVKHGIKYEVQKYEANKKYKLEKRKLKNERKRDRSKGNFWRKD